MFDKILVVLSSSPSTWAAVFCVWPIASSFGSEVHLLGMCMDDQPGLEPAFKDYLENLASSFQRENIAVKTTLSYGNPANEIVKYAETNAITLITGINRSDSIITRSLLPSAAKGIRQHVFIPLLMVLATYTRPMDRLEKANFHRILVPLDPSETSEAVLPYVEAIAKKVGNSVTLLTVNSPPVRAVPVIHNEVIKMSQSIGKAYTEQVAERIHEHGIAVSFEIVDGKPAKIILGYAKEREADLIAMCTRGIDVISRWIWGSVTNKVLRRTEVPVFVISCMGFRASETSP